MKELFPEIEPYKTHRLKVSDVHEIYIEEVGNPSGQPALFLHGGPGGGITPKHRRYFDPKHYRIILFDQRGAGKSTPHAELEGNTTWDLVADIEQIREMMGIEKWMVFGGSWGSTLALSYAQKHPETVSSLVLRGIFLVRPEEIQWFYQDGAKWIFPDYWENYENMIPEAERSDMIGAYYRRLTSDDESVRKAAAKAWSVWEGSTIRLVPNDEEIKDFGEDHLAVSLARIECHYFNNRCWLEPNQLINDVPKIAHIPSILIHGRYDVVCPVKNAWDLHKAWPNSQLKILPTSGHGGGEEAIIDALVSATEEFKGVK